MANWQWFFNLSVLNKIVSLNIVLVKQAMVSYCEITLSFKYWLLFCTCFSLIIELTPCLITCRDGLGNIQVDWTEGCCPAFCGMFFSRTRSDPYLISSHICIHDCNTCLDSFPPINRSSFTPWQGIWWKFSIVVMDHVLTISSFHSPVCAATKICEKRALIYWGCRWSVCWRMAFFGGALATRWPCNHRLHMRAAKKLDYI